MYLMLETHTVGICEEAYARHDNESNMVPAKWSLVDLSEGHPPPLIGIGYVVLYMLAVCFAVTKQVPTYTPCTSL